MNADREEHSSGLPDGWQLVELGEIADITKLAGFEFTKYFEYIENGEVIGLRALNLNDGRLDLSDVKRISKEVSDSLERSKLYVGDILFSYTGSIGEVAIVDADDKYHLAPNVCRIRLFDGNDVFFVYSYFRSQVFKHSVWSYVVGSTQPTIPMKNIRKIQIPLPPPQEQKLIADVFVAIHEKIELNRKHNRTLDAIAQALFKSWFVDFEFPDANGQPYKSGGGAMQPSELGETPGGWRVGKLEEIIGELETGSRPKGGVGQFTEGVPSIGAESITRIGEYDYSKTKYVPEEYFAKMRRGLIKDRDVLIYKDGGQPGRFDARISMFGGGFPYETACLNEHVFRLQAKKRIYQNYLYLWFSSYYILEELRFRGTKAAIPGINSTDLKELAFLFMDEGVLEKFDEVIEPLFSKLLHNSREMAVLGKLRDALLPKLMSGELRVM